MKEKLQAFMAGRYGHDELNFMLLGLAVVCIILSLFFGRVFSFLAFLAAAYALFRTMSRNFSARSEENRRFLPIYGKILPYINITRARIKGRGKYRYFLCPSCKKVLRVPKGKGHITLRCPCGMSFKGKS